MHKIQEKELVEFAANNAISLMEIEEHADGYGIKVQLTWREGRSVLMTQRNSIKTWASLDRLIAHIKTNYIDIPEIHLKLRRTKKSGKKIKPDKNTKSNKE